MSPIWTTSWCWIWEAPKQCQGGTYIAKGPLSREPLNAAQLRSPITLPKCQKSLNWYSCSPKRRKGRDLESTCNAYSAKLANKCSVEHSYQSGISTGNIIVLLFWCDRRFWPSAAALTELWQPWAAALWARPNFRSSGRRGRRSGRRCARRTSQSVRRDAGER